MQPVKKSFWKRRSVQVLLLVLVVLIALLTWFAVVAIDHPPVVNDLSELQIQRTIVDSNCYLFGNNWLRKNENGLWEMYIEGKPFERGVAFGQLTKELLYYQESVFFDQIRELVPSDRYLKVLKYFIAFFNRNLDKSIPDEYKKEIYGTSFACSPEYDFIGTGYQRQLNYHAAHDIGHALQGLNLVACTSFSVWNGKSTDSSLVIGRNFDFYMGDRFAENKIVCFMKPDKGYKFMMITWADLIGVVSGMNEKGLTVTLNASKSTIPTHAATPVTLLAREILQYASNIDEAYRIAGKYKLFVSESIMIGSAADHQTVIIEKSPDKMGLFESAEDYIISSNHFQGKEFSQDEINLENIQGSDSYNRYRRVDQLIGRKSPLRITDVAGILRDQLVAGDSDAGMGNQLAINQMIAHHSVIFKPDSLLVWVSTSPWQIGKYMAYDLNKIFALKKEEIGRNKEISWKEKTIPADTFLYSPAYTSFMHYKAMNQKLREMTNNQDLLPEGFAEEFVNTNPLFYHTYSVLADYYYSIRDFRNAKLYYSKALTKILPGKDERKKLEEHLEKTIKKIE